MYLGVFFFFFSQPEMLGVLMQRDDFLFVHDSDHVGGTSRDYASEFNFFLSIDYNSSKVNIFPGDSRNISQMPPIGLVLGSPRFPLISRVQHQLVCARMLASRVAHKLRSFSYIPLGGRDVTNVFWES